MVQRAKNCADISGAAMTIMENHVELCDLQINLDVVDLECNFPPIDFGQVGVGCRKTAVITVRGPASPKYTMYTYIFEPKNTSEIDSVFAFEGCSKGRLEVGVEDTKIMKVHFKPDLPHRTYSSLLWISVHEAGRLMKVNHIFITGSSRGSGVAVDSTKLIFVLKNSCEPDVKYLKLTNDSEQDTDFMLENHCEHSAFKIEPKFGNIGPRATMELKMEFRQDKTGMNKCILPILFSKQAPIFVELYGVYSMDKNCDWECALEHYQTEIKLDYASYMSDVHPVGEEVERLWPTPAGNIVVSPDSIISWDNCHENEESFNSLAIELYNRNCYKVYVVWEEYFFTDKWIPFEIEPVSGIIDSKESSEFIVSFHPLSENEFYSCVRRALIYRLPENNDDANIEVNPEKLMEMMIVPEVMTIRLIGDTYFRPLPYPEWEPIGRVITMPECYLSEATYTTFAIRNVDREPMAFRFESPKDSHFCVKPYMGVVQGSDSGDSNYQLIVVKMVSSPIDEPVENKKFEQLFYECWKIVLNEERCEYVKFRGSVENIHVAFGQEETKLFAACLDFKKPENCINFNPVRRISEDKVEVTIYNNTRHSLGFRCDKAESHKGKLDILKSAKEVVDLSPEESTIGNQQRIVQTWHFHEANEETRFNIFWKFWITDNKEKRKSIAVTVVVELDELKLEASRDPVNILISDFHNDHIVEDFSVKNLNNKHIKLSILFISDNQIRFNPSIFRIESGESKNVTIRYTPIKLVEETRAVNIELMRDSGEVAHCMKLFDLRITCRFDLKLQETKFHTETNKFISEYFLRNFMEINRLQDICNDLEPNEKPNPEFQLKIPCRDLDDDEKFTVHLRCRNDNTFPIAWRFKRINCPCSRSPQTRQCCCGDYSISINWGNEFFCVQPNSKNYLTIEISKDSNKKKLPAAWAVNIMANRSFDLTIVPVKPSIVSSSFMTFNNFPSAIRKFSDVPYQALWLCNDSGTVMPYQVSVNYDRTPMESSNATGSLDAFARTAVVLRIKSDQLSINTVEFRDVGSTCESMKICAEPVDDCVVPGRGDRRVAGDDADIFQLGLFASIEPNFIELTVATNREDSRSFIMKNIHKEHALTYKWTNCIVPETVHVEFRENSEGTLGPETQKEIKFHVKTDDREFIIDVDLYCRFEDCARRSKIWREKNFEECSKSAKLKPVVFWRTFTVRVIAMDSAKLRNNTWEDSEWQRVTERKPTKILDSYTSTPKVPKSFDVAKPAPSPSFSSSSSCSSSFECGGLASSISTRSPVSNSVCLFDKPATDAAINILENALTAILRDDDDVLRVRSRASNFTYDRVPTNPLERKNAKDRADLLGSPGEAEKLLRTIISENLLPDDDTVLQEKFKGPIDSVEKHQLKKRVSLPPVSPRLGSNLQSRVKSMNKLIGDQGRRWTH